MVKRSKRKRKKRPKTPAPRARKRPIREVGTLTPVGRFDLDLPQLPCGYAAESVRGVDRVPVNVKGFVTSFDGDTFIRRIEGWPDSILGALPAPVSQSGPNLGTMVAVFNKERRCRVYINPQLQVAMVRAKRDVAKGQAITEEDFLDVPRLEIRDVEVPPDSGIIAILSYRWRKGYFYDFKPVNQPFEPRDYDIWEALGACYTQLIFADLFAITDEEWAKLFEQGWFPFSSLSRDLQKKMLTHIRARWPVDDLLDDVANEVAALLDKLEVQADRHPSLLPHAELIKTAIGRYRADDFVSTVSVLVPRIEGIVRTYRAQTGMSAHAKHPKIAATVAAGQIPMHSSLLPAVFEAYLRDVIFANFNPADPQGLSRNTVSHGVAAAESFDRKGAVLALLTVNQLAHYLGPPTAPSVTS